MLKIKDNADLKELEKFGFEEYNNGYSRKYSSGYETFINKLNREVFDLEITDTQIIMQEKVTRADDLIKTNLVEKVGE